MVRWCGGALSMLPAMYMLRAAMTTNAATTMTARISTFFCGERLGCNTQQCIENTNN